MFGLADSHLATLAGFGGGILLGLAARVGRYCIMGAVEDAVYGADLGRMRMLAMSAALAIAGTFGLITAGVLDPDVTRYFRTAWSPAGTVIGVAAYATIAGPLALLRLWLVPPTAIEAGSADHGLPISSAMRFRSPR